MDSENEVGDVTEEDDPKPFRQCCKDEFGLETESSIRCCLSKKKHNKISNSNIDQAHVEFLFGKGRPIDAQKEMNSVQNHSYTQFRCLTQRNPFNGSL